MIFAPRITPEDLKGQYIFFDSDFLGVIFSDPELLKESITLIDGFRVIDGFTRLEFLRDVWLPEIREKKEEFLNSDIFCPIMEHQELFKQIKENALELSRLYAHENNSGKKGSVSTVDLLLAGTLMFYPNSILVTGNKKDFPSCIFDTKGVFNFEQGDGSMRAISLVKFNQDKFETQKAAYANVPARR